jgi:CrcB protein
MTTLPPEPPTDDVDDFIDPDVEPQDARDPVLHPTVLAVIAVGGALGSIARWGVAEALPHPPGGFPTSTLVVNLTGSFMLGALLVVVSERLTDARLLRPFVGVGLLGGFTTFSTAMLDVHELVQGGRAPLAVGYLALSVLAGLAAVLLGAAAVRALSSADARTAAR